jgi:2-methylcitrate dehydratase PrpD
MEAFSPGRSCMMTGIATGFTAKGAVFSALMAETGITGAVDSLEGKAGLYPVYFGDDYKKEALVEELGTRFESGEVSIKPWPGVRYTHSYIDATLQLIREYAISADDIRQIRVFAAGWVQTMCEPQGKARK